MGSLSPPLHMRVKSICIIGSGPSGLAAAKYLLAEQAFSRIVIFERRSRIGGLWNHVPCPEFYSESLQIPQRDPWADHDQPIWRKDHQERHNGNEKARPEFMTPLYDRLETNIPRGLMGFSDLDWPKDCQLFPKHDEVLQYIEKYAADVRHLIDFNTQVLDVKQNSDGGWTVKTQRLSPDKPCEVEEHSFDAIVAANGHFNIPYIPSVAGIEAWNKAYPGSILHSKFYRQPEYYAGKNVIVVGNSASGVDIGDQIATVCKQPLLQSQKSESYLQPDKSSTKIEKPEIVEYLPQDRSVRFADGSKETEIDAIVYCTGYFYSFPFLKSLDPPVIKHGERVENTYQHIFYRPNPTLAFCTLNQKVIPFPVAEVQSAVIARAWSGRVKLPSKMQMAAWEDRTLQETGGGRNFHVLKFPKDADYINMLSLWASDIDSSKAAIMQTNGQTNGVHDSAGKTPPYWGEKEYWTRERFPAIKKAFQSLGEERHSKRTLEDVGFDFAEWKRDSGE